MAGHHLPVRPNLDQLKHQAKDLRRALRRGDSGAVAEFAEFHPEQPDRKQDCWSADQSRDCRRYRAGQRHAHPAARFRYDKRDEDLRRSQHPNPPAMESDPDQKNWFWPR